MQISESKRSVTWFSWQRFLFCLVGLLLPLFPHFVHEFIENFPNSHLLTMQSEIRVEKSFMFEHILRVFDVFWHVRYYHFKKAMLLPSIITILCDVFIYLSLFFGLVIILKKTRFLFRSSIEQKEKLELYALIVILFGFIYVVNLKELGGRYIHFILPSLALVTAIGLERFLLSIKRHFFGWRISCLLVAAVFSMGALRFHYFKDYKHKHNLTYQLHQQAFEDIHEVTKWEKRDILNRTMFIHYTGGYLNTNSYDYNLIGEDFRSSNEDVGVIYIFDPHIRKKQPFVEKDLEQEIVDYFLMNTEFEGLPASKGVLPDIKLISVERVNRNFIYLYKKNNGRAFGSMTNRYIKTEDELIALEEGKLIPEFTSKLIMENKDEKVFVIHMDKYHYLHLKLRQKERLEAVLSSNQLRGRVDNRGGYYSSYTIEEPSLEFINSNSNVKYKLKLSKGWVGLIGEAAPILTEMPLLPLGKYRLTFETKSKYFHLREDGFVGTDSVARSIMLGDLVLQ